MDKLALLNGLDWIDEKREQKHRTGGETHGWEGGVFPRMASRVPRPAKQLLKSGSCNRHGCQRPAGRGAPSRGLQGQVLFGNWIYICFVATTCMATVAGGGSKGH